MRRSRSPVIAGGWVALMLVLAGACRRDLDVLSTVAHTSPAPAVATDIVLEVRANARVDVGDPLDLELWVRNDSNAPVTLVRPVYGSWELARHPRYELRWTDEDGARVADPLGFAPGLSCGTFDLLTRGDLVHVTRGSTAILANGPSARASHDVLASARPGRYTLQVVYLAQGIEGATPLQLLSEPVPIEIVGGDLAMWSCRAEQLADEANHVWIDVNAGGVVSTDGGFWLMVRDYRHRVVDGQDQPGGEIRLQRLAADLSPVGDPQQVRALDEEVGWVSIAATGEDLLVVATPGSVGGRRVEAQAITLADGQPSVAPPIVLQAAPGNPYITRVVARGDRFAVFHGGDEDHERQLMMRVVDRSGAPITEPRTIARGVVDFAIVPLAGDALLGVWLQRSDAGDGGIMQRLSAATGGPVGEPIRFEFDPAHGLAGARVDRGSLELAWADAITRGGDPIDRMGLYVRRFAMSNGHAEAPARALTPESRTTADFGAVAWHGGRWVRASLEGPTLRLGSEAGTGTVLSSEAGGNVAIETMASGSVVLWTDHRDDPSRACRTLEQCVSEVYGVRLDPDGSVRAGPVRLTRQARPKAFVPSTFDWQQHCP